MTAPQNVLPIDLQKLILEYQNKPEELITKLHLILEHLKSTGKENLEGFQYFSRGMDIVINQLGKPGIAGNEIVGLNISNKPLVDHESPSSSEATSGHLQEGHDSTTGDKSNQNDDLYALSRVLDAKSSTMEIQQSKEAETREMDESELRLAQLQHQLPSNEPGALMHLVEDASNEDEDDLETKECKSLFKDVKIFLSREVPRESLPFVIPAFGGVVSWEGEGAPFNESDQSITHQIVDHPTQGNRFLSRQYVQPQWIYDCVNSRIILPVEEYLVGRVPPPYLSPFVDNEAEVSSS